MCREASFPRIATVLTILVAACVCIGAEPTVIYVDDDAIGANNGTSWPDAYLYLQDALADANSAPKPVEIRVARGTYKPDRGSGITPGDRCATFQLLNGVTIRGGYAGLDQPDPDMRDSDLHPSILSGDLLNNDLADPNYQSFHESRYDNSASVVCGSYTDNTAVIDGFVIAHAYSVYADCADEPGTAAMVVASGGPRVLNCRLEKDRHTPKNLSVHQDGWPEFLHCVFEGEGCYIVQSSPAFRQCVFRNIDDAVLECNESYIVLEDSLFEDNRIGIEAREGTSLTLAHCTIRRHSLWALQVFDQCTVNATDCLFEQNDFGLKCLGGDLALTDCTFTGHESSTVDCSSDGTLIATRCAFEGNSDDTDAAIDGAWSSSMILTDCVFRNNFCTDHWGDLRSSGAIVSTGESCILRNCTFSGNIGSCVETGRSNDAFEAHGCVFTGNRAASGAGIEVRATLGLVANCLFAGNHADREGGGVSGLGQLAKIRNCTFFANTADEGGGAIAGSGKITNCIIRDNEPDQLTVPSGITWGARPSEPTVSFCNIQGGWPGEGNIDVDPCFVETGYWDANDTPEDPNDDVWIDGDYHLISQAGRWDPETKAWLQDDTTSPCIDAGDPNSPIGTEPFPNGGRANMGAYGTGAQASKTYFGTPVCETIIAGDINGDCIVDCEDFAIMSSHWLVQGTDFVNSPPTVAIIEPQDGAQFDWPGPTTFRAIAEDSDGEVVRVNFNLWYKGENVSVGMGCYTNQVGDTWEGQKTWPGWITQGYWTVQAKATDNKAAVGKSEEITIYLHDPDGNPQMP